MKCNHTNYNGRRAAALLCAIFLCLVLLPQPAYALQGTEGDTHWALDGGTLTITGKGCIPNYSDAAPAPWGSHTDEITRIVIGDGITRIGALAFYGCTRAKSVAFPSTLQEIGSGAFKDCRQLERIALPAVIFRIGESAFEGCQSLTAAYLPEGLRAIGSYAFSGCTALTAVSIPASVTDFGIGVFSGCNGLIAAAVHATVCHLPPETFSGCWQLSVVALPQTLESIESGAFRSCSGITDVYYTGDAISEVKSVISSQAENAQVLALPCPNTISGSSAQLKPDGKGAVEQKTEITETPNSTIIGTDVIDSDFYIDGEGATLQEITSLPADHEKEISSTGTITSKIDASVKNNEGWSEIAERINNTLQDIGNNLDTKVTVEAAVSIPDKEVTGDQLSGILGKNVTLELTTDSGEKWRIDGSAVNKRDLSGKSYDLGYSIEQTDNKALQADAVYKLKFGGNTDFSASFAIAVPSGIPGQYATLLEKKGKSYNELQTVLIDESGNAWFSINGASARGKYFIAVNAKNANISNAYIPHTMQDQYQVDEEYTLTDAQGNRYSVGQRESSWGITQNQFMLYAGIGIGAVVLVVSFIMITMNIMKKTRTKAALEHDAAQNTENIDEESLRLEIMQEMLAECEKNKKKGP